MGFSRWDSMARREQKNGIVGKPWIVPLIFGPYHFPSGYVKIAIENGPFIVDFPINSMVIFHTYVNVYQRVTFRYFQSSQFNQ